VIINASTSNPDAFDDVELSVTFQSTEGDTSATLGTFSGPNA
jgi:hypothetical protein